MTCHTAVVAATCLLTLDRVHTCLAATGDEAHHVAKRGADVVEGDTFFSQHVPEDRTTSLQDFTIEPLDELVAQEGKGGLKLEIFELVSQLVEVEADSVSYTEDVLEGSGMFQMVLGRSRGI